MTETEASIALNMLPGMGPVRLRKLLEVFHTPERVLLAKSTELRSVDGVGTELAGKIAEWESHVDLAGELRRIEEFGARVITRNSPDYPRELRRLHNPPIILYVWGSLTESDHRAMGVVGSRKTSHYGIESAKKLSYQLAYAGLTVISGLARGIDTAAHQGALAAKGRTVAVIGSGLMDLYPPENLALAEKIAESGAVVSEFPMQFPPSAQTFPYRNRIVAGWGAGVLVVEAGLNSGAIITATQALDQGRLVYAVPGQIDKPTSAGSNRLIQQQNWSPPRVIFSTISTCCSRRNHPRERRARPAPLRQRKRPSCKFCRKASRPSTNWSPTRCSQSQKCRQLFSPSK
jgi:DNA processing protein